jgi:hypothetical protein
MVLAENGPEADLIVFVDDGVEVVLRMEDAVPE